MEVKNFSIVHNGLKFVKILQFCIRIKCILSNDLQSKMRCHHLFSVLWGTQSGLKLLQHVMSYRIIFPARDCKSENLGSAQLLSFPFHSFKAECFDQEINRLHVETCQCIRSALWYVRLGNVTTHSHTLYLSNNNNKMKDIVCNLIFSHIPKWSNVKYFFP